MKYFKYILILSILLSGVAFAENTSTSKGIFDTFKQKISEVKQKATEDKAIIKAQVASTTASIKKAKEELKSAIELRIGKKLDTQKLKIVNVFENSIQNLKDVVTRIESRLVKISVTNISNVSSSKLLLDTAKGQLALAETELTTLANLLASDILVNSTSTIKNTERKTLLQSIKTQSDKTKTAIKLAHESIVKVVASLKLGQPEKNNSTSTRAISTSTNNN